MRCLFVIYITLFSISVRKQEPLRKFQLSGFAQGTTYSITYYAEDSIVTQQMADSVFTSLDSSLSIYRSYSLINAFNRSATGLELDVHLLNVVRRALQVYVASGGTFDVTVLPLTNAWNFGTEKKDSLPGATEIEQIMQCVGSDKLQLAGNFLGKQFPCAQLDVNGIAQGYSLDVLADLLRCKNIADYIIELGGELRMKGRKHPTNERMRIGIESPGSNPYKTALIRKVISFDSGAVTTSGSYRRYYEANGKHISHIIDPRTGATAENELISVTVFAKDAITADAYDNALMVMGLATALKFATDSKEIEAYFIYRTKNGKVADVATPGFKSLFVN